MFYLGGRGKRYRLYRKAEVKFVVAYAVWLLGIGDRMPAEAWLSRNSKKYAVCTVRHYCNIRNYKMAAG